MNRRSWSALLALALTVGVVYLAWPTGPRPCRATFEMVKEGMTLEEVATTVGGPPGVYSNRLNYPVMMGGYGFCSYETWVARDCTLVVIVDDTGQFGEAGRVVAVWLY